MGRVTTEAIIENLDDLWAVRRRALPPERVRRVVVPDALAYTGASWLSLPISVIHELGLGKIGSRRMTTSSGAGASSVYDAVRLTIQGRSITVDVAEVPDGVPVLIGQLPLEGLDLIVDLRNRTLIGNPAHGGEYIIEMY